VYYTFLDGTNILKIIEESNEIVIVQDENGKIFNMLRNEIVKEIDKKYIDSLISKYSNK